MNVEKTNKRIRYLGEEKRLLIAELDDTLLQFLVNYYSQKDYKSQGISSTEEVLSAIKEFSPQVVLISWKIGINILRDIHGIDEFCSILLFTRGEIVEYPPDPFEIFATEGIYDLGNKDQPEFPEGLIDIEWAFDIYLSRFKSRYLGGIVFVLMPFSEEFNDIYFSGIKPAVEDCGLICERVDEQHFTDPILKKIFENIKKARFIVAEMTGKNPNVYYEVGYAHATSKPVILLTQDLKDIPFDLKDRPHINYGGDIAMLKQRLSERLISLIEQEIGWKEDN
jgi:hypothetical protein